MARNLAHEQNAFDGDPHDQKATTGPEKQLLNRREYVQLSAAATATVAGGSGLFFGVTSGSSDTVAEYRTTFSEYGDGSNE